jgi:hypothetical protein
VVAPVDARLYAAQKFVFAETNQDSVSALLNRGPGRDGGDALTDSATGAWVRVIGALLNANDPFHATGEGVEGGADLNVTPGGKVGVAFGYEATSLSDSLGGGASQQIARVGVYGSQSLGAAVVSGAVDYAHAWDKTDRATGVTPSTAASGSDVVTGGVQIAVPIHVEEVMLTPSAGVIATSVRGGGFSEANALPAFAVTGLRSSFGAVEPYALVDLSRAFKTSDGGVITPTITVGYRHDGVADAAEQTLVAQDGTVFAGNKLGLGPNTAVLGASISLQRGALTGFLRYRASVADNWNDQSLSAGVRWSF